MLGCPGRKVSVPVSEPPGAVKSASAAGGATALPTAIAYSTVTVPAVVRPRCTVMTAFAVHTLTV